jgi:hypothetical protein
MVFLLNIIYKEFSKEMALTVLSSIIMNNEKASCLYKGFI